MPFPKAPTPPNATQATRPGAAELGTLFETTWITSKVQDSPLVRSLHPSFPACLLNHPFAVWISPVSQNYQGARTVYGDPYHGYWIADHSQLNDRFGTSDDLKALSDEVHRRGMCVPPPCPSFCQVIHCCSLLHTGI